MLAQEVQNHVAPLAYVAGVHGHFAEEVAHVGHDDGECAESVPEVVEGDEAFGTHAGALIGQGDERAAQLDGVGHVFAQETLGEMEHVARGQMWLPRLRVQLPLCALQVAVAADDFFVVGVPHDELLVAVLAGVEFVEVAVLARSATGLAEGLLTQTANLAHHVGGIMSRYDEYLVVALIRHAQLTVGRQLALQ